MAIVVQTADRVSHSRRTNGTALTINKPANVVSGDLLRFILMMANSASGAGTNSVTLPAGFTEIVHAHRVGSNAGGEILAGYKIAGGSEPASYAYDAEFTGGNHNVVIDRITGHDATTPIGNTSKTDHQSGTAPTVPTLTVGSDGSLLTACIAVRGSTDPTVTADSPLTSSINFTGANARANVAHQDVDSGATGTRSWTLSVSSDAATAMFAINPDTVATRYIPDVEPLYYIGTLLASKINLKFMVTAGHDSLTGAILGSGTNGTTDSLGNFVLPAGVTLSDQGDPVAADDPVMLHLHWKEGNPAVDRSIIVETTLVAEA